MSLFLLATSIFAQFQPNATVSSINYAGSGCISGALNTPYVSPDVDMIHLEFKDMTATVGSHSRITDSRKFCQINLSLHYDYTRYQYRFVTGFYQGSVNLLDGQTGVGKTTTYFSGQTAQYSTQSTWKNATADIDVVVDATNNNLWSSCQGNFPINIKTQVQFENGNNGAPDASTVTLSDGIYYLEWREC
ncbi:hypothetical protein HDV01_006966 [Terramyces sp. JEL0728]|nr:hypothetical protein HDV01_006966 [Terramyces sp. JEL0728]